MIIDDILAIRERWHTKNHPFFRAFAEGKLPLRAMGVYKAMHWKFVQHGLASFGILYARTIAHEDVRKAIAENISEEEGFKALNTEVVLPAFARHYGFPAGSPEIEFFTEHAEADLEHSRRQATLCAKYLDSDAAKARALEVAEQACLLRWASITDLYRREYLGEKEILPSGVD